MNDKSIELTVLHQINDGAKIKAIDHLALENRLYTHEAMFRLAIAKRSYTYERRG
jgi:hypothetical protein